MADPIGYPTAPRYIPNSEQHRRLLGEQGQRHNQGKTNNIIVRTLTANAASTTITDARISPASYLGFMPETANAAAEIATLYVSDSGRVGNSVAVSHANNAQTDRTFRIVIVG